MSSFPCGIVVLTAFGVDGRPRGLTANILVAGREQLAQRMATKLTDKFDGLVCVVPMVFARRAYA